MSQSNAHSPPVSLQLLNLSQLHNSTAHIPETLSRKVGAGDVLKVRSKVDTGVLLSVSVSRYVMC